MLSLVFAAVCFGLAMWMYLDHEEGMALLMLVVGILNLVIGVASVSDPDPYYQSRSELNTLVEKCELRLTRDRRCELVAVPIPVEK